MDGRSDGETGYNYNATCLTPTDDQMRLGSVELFSLGPDVAKIFREFLFVIVKGDFEYY